MDYQPTSINISAEQGKPSTFWKSKSDLYYTTKALAVEDKANNAVNPNDYALNKSFFMQHKKTILISVVVLALVAGGLFLWKKGKIVVKTA